MIFVDTSFWVALNSAADAHHADAAVLFKRHAAATLVTTNLVRGETWTFMRRRWGHAPAVAFLDRLARSHRVRCEHVDAVADQRALAWLRERDEREYSHVDATSFVVMRALRIRQAFAFDNDFAAAGFIELRP